MFKYKNLAENIEPYKIPSTTDYKYKMDMGEWSLSIHSSVLDEFKNFNSLSYLNFWLLKPGVCIFWRKVEKHLFNSLNPKIKFLFRF